MKKFRNKRTGAVIEVNLLYYINKYSNNPQYEEIIEDNNSKEVEVKKSTNEMKREVTRNSLLR